MANNGQLNPQVTNTLDVTRDNTLCAKVVMVEGQGKAYQAVAQSVSIAIQDVTDYLRNVSTVSATAQGVAMAKILEDVSKASDYEPAIQKANDMITEAATMLKNVGDSGADILQGFGPQSA